MSIIKLNINKFIRNEHSSQNAFRKAIKANLIAVTAGKLVVNNETGFEIRFNKVGIDKMISTLGEYKCYALSNLQLILKNGKLSTISDDRADRPDILSYHLFKTDVCIDNEIKEIWCYVRQREEGFFLYSVNVKA